MTRQLEGKVALVTGGGSGIGRASALVFAREGALVVVADVDTNAGEETARLIVEEGGQASFVQTDVSKAAEVEDMVDHAVRTYGALNCALNNAGIEGRQAQLADYTEEDWNRVISVNLSGVWRCMKYELLHMVKQGDGVIVNTSSTAGVVGFPFFPAYVASKHGIIGLTKAAALEYASAGIRVNAVCPGHVRSGMTERLGIFSDPEFEEQVAAAHPIGRIGTALEVAEAAVWLCTEAASFVTGHAMAVDGGYVAQ